MCSLREWGILMCPPGAAGSMTPALLILRRRGRGPRTDWAGGAGRGGPGAPGAAGICVLSPRRSQGQVARVGRDMAELSKSFCQGPQAEKIMLLALPPTHTPGQRLTKLMASGSRAPLASCFGAQVPLQPLDRLMAESPTQLHGPYFSPLPPSFLRRFQLGSKHLADRFAFQK